LKKLNGVVLPGGDGDYYEFGRTILEQVIIYNDLSLFYLVFGVYMGFEDIMAMLQTLAGKFLATTSFTMRACRLNSSLNPPFQNY